MIRLSLQLLTGLVLCGCTVNNYHSTMTTSYDQRSTTELLASVDTFRERSEPSHTTEAEGVKVVPGNLKIKPGCEIYVPLPVPKPVKIDFKELESAESGKEINAITLRNVRELHQQLNSYAARQQKHYSDYVQRCVVK